MLNNALRQGDNVKGKTFLTPKNKDSDVKFNLQLGSQTRYLVFLDFNILIHKMVF